MYYDDLDPTIGTTKIRGANLNHMDRRLGILFPGLSYCYTRGPHHSFASVDDSVRMHLPVVLYMAAATAAALDTESDSVHNYIHYNVDKTKSSSRASGGGSNHYTNMFAQPAVPRSHTGLAEAAYPGLETDTSKRHNRTPQSEVDTARTALAAKHGWLNVSH